MKLCVLVHASIFQGQRWPHAIYIYMWNKPLLNKLQGYIKSFTLWWRTWTIGYDEVEGLLFQEIKSRFKKIGIHFYGHVINHKTIWTRITWQTRWRLNSSHMLKAEGVMAVFLKNCSQIFEWRQFWAFRCFWRRRFMVCFKVWHHQNWNFAVSKMGVSGFLLKACSVVIA